jgi:protein-L-isoaspartate(D-aspartate) O-methyltransferase
VTALRKTEPEAGPSSPEALRAGLTCALRARGAIRTDEVTRAFRTVPRHLFAPEVPAETAYADDSIITPR